MCPTHAADRQTASLRAAVARPLMSGLSVTQEAGVELNHLGVLRTGEVAD